MKNRECSNEFENVSNNSIALSRRKSQRMEIWPTRSDYFRSSNSGQEMKWFKGSRNRGVRFVKQDHCAA